MLQQQAHSLLQIVFLRVLDCKVAGIHWNLGFQTSCVRIIGRVFQGFRALALKHRDCNSGPKSAIYVEFQADVENGIAAACSILDSWKLGNGRARRREEKDVACIPDTRCKTSQI